jgi:molecular chaperone GrpE
VVLVAEDKKQDKMEERSVDEDKEVNTNPNEQQEENEQVEPIFAEGDKTDTLAEQQTDENHQAEGTDEQKADETAELKARIEQLEKELDEKDNRLIRVQADFDNYRKRTRNEIEAIEKYRSQPLATELLGVVDNFERALQTNVTSEDAKALLQGMEMVYKGMLEAFKKEGIEPIESVGKEFDPHEHHAVMQGSDEQVESNIVLEEFQKGYRLKDRVIRPAMVKVNQ